MDELAYWLGFSLIPDIGPARVHKLLDYFGTLDRAWHATERELSSSDLEPSAQKSILAHRPKLDLAHELARVRDVGARLLALNEPNYPSLLRKISDPPLVLYVRGELIPQDELALAIVGTRRATKYGYDATFMIAKDLGRHGITIVSGLAEGIDHAAHRGCLTGEGRTIAVLGCGIDVIYPAKHDKLAAYIVDHGALVSELPVGTQPRGMNFPRRNRLISGLAQAVLVGEAPHKSGSLHTVDAAIDQQRDVFAIPANIFNANGAACNRLIQDGARLVTSARDIVETLNMTYHQQQTAHTTERISPASDLERDVLQWIEADPITVDEIIQASGLETQDVLATLTILELKGLVQNCGPVQYCRTP